MVGYGKIHFSVKYENNKLDVKIIECKGLKDTDFIGKSDPYVRLYILPGKHTELKTKTVNNNINPVFNMSFSFTLTTAQMLSKTAIFQVFDSDFGKDGKLGEARFPFSEMNLDNHTEVKYWIDLQEITETPPTVKHRSMSTVSTTVVSRESNLSKKVSNASYSSIRPPIDRSYEYSYSETSGHGHVKNMSLRELNNRLDYIVAQNKKYDDVDTKLIINLLSKKVNDNVSSHAVLTKIDQNLQPLRDEYNTLAMLNAEIEILKRENDILQVRTDEIEEKIALRTTKERELANTLRDLEAKHSQLQRERDAMESRRQTHEMQLIDARDQMKPVLEQLRTMQLEYGKWQGEYDLVVEKNKLCRTERDRLYSTLSAKMEREIECPSIHWDILDEYTKRMDEELRLLKEMYVSYNSEIKGLESKEIARLNTTLNEAGYHESGDLSGVLGELEIVKKKMLELEMDKLNIRQKIFELRFNLDQEEALFFAQFDAKEGALAFLKSEYEAMRRKFFSNLSMVEESEVLRYSRIIPEEEHETARRSSKYESSDRKVVMGLALEPKISSNDGEVVGWNIQHLY